MYICAPPAACLCGHILVQAESQEMSVLLEVVVLCVAIMHVPGTDIPHVVVHFCLCGFLPILWVGIEASLSR